MSQADPIDTGAPPPAPIAAHVEDLPPFASPPLEQDLREAGIGGPIRRMHLNECPYPPSPKVIAALQAAAAGVNRYPDGWVRELGDAIAGMTGVPRERQVFGNGSDHLLQMIADVFMDRGGNAVVPDPSFGRYIMATRVARGAIAAVPVRADGANDVPAMLAAIGPATRIVFAASPNNPTGQMLNADELAELARAVPETVLLVLDEAYYEFAAHVGGPNGLEIVSANRRGPWIVARTVSKSYALAGLRCGYGLCATPEIAAALHKIRQSFQVNIMAQIAAIAALGDPDYAEWLQEQNAIQRQRTLDGLLALGFAPLPTVANFVTARTPDGGPAAPIIQALARRGIMIGGIRTPTPGFDRYIRITFGSAEDTDALLAALGEVVAQA